MQGYEDKIERLDIQGGAALKIRSLRDRLQYHDPLGIAAAAGISPASWPLFGLVWPSARKLAGLMQHWPLGPSRILEIGCGLGLASLVIHRRQGNITASDYHPLTEEFLSANLSLNQLPDMPYATGHWEKFDNTLGQFDLIIGSDVLYERNHPEQLATFISQHSAPRAEVLIVDPNRSNRSAFNQKMNVLGFSHTETTINSPLEDNSPYHGRLLHYQRNSTGHDNTANRDFRPDSTNS